MTQISNPSAPLHKDFNSPNKQIQIKITKSLTIMKKTIYIILLFIVSALSITACTEQEVKPKDGGAGGSVLDPKG